MLNATIILSNIFACPSAILSHPSGIESSFKKLLWNDLEASYDYNHMTETYADNNYFIKDFGTIRLFGNPNKHAFVSYTVPMALKQSDLYNITVCYGSKANFCFRMKNNQASVIIRPIIHFFPSKMVNILYSCYISASDMKSLLKTINQLKLSNDTMYDIPMHCEKKYYQGINCLKNLTLYIRKNIEGSLDNYDFDNAALKLRHCHVSFSGGEVDCTEFKEICSSLKKAGSKYSNTDKIEKHLAQEYESEQFLVTPGLSVYYNADQKSSSWVFFRDIEYILIANLTLEFIDLVSKEVLNDLHKEKKSLISINSFKINYYNEDFEELANDYINSMNNNNSYVRLMTYLYYGGKERFEKKFAEYKETYQKLLSQMENRESIWVKFIKKLVPMFG